MTELLEFAKTYMATKINTSLWDSMTDAIKEKYLAEALRQVKSLDGINLPDELTNDLKIAVCEVCLNVINCSDNEQYKNLQAAGVTSISYGNDSVSFGNKTVTTTENAYINDYAYSLLRKYIQRSYKIV